MKNSIGLIKDGITPEELGRAKSGYLQQQQLSRSRDAGLASVLADTAHVGRTMQYYAGLDKRIEAVTPAQVLEALRKHFDAERLVVVSLPGDFRPDTDPKEPKPATP